MGFKKLRTLKKIGFGRIGSLNALRDMSLR
jgi:hypothetical protein